MLCESAALIVLSNGIRKHPFRINAHHVSQITIIVIVI